VIGPSLFIALINRLSEVGLDTKSNIILYADDLVYTHPLHSESSENIVQREMNLLSECIQSMGLNLNKSKCQYMVLGLGNQKYKPQIQIAVNGENLQKVTVYKYLGIEIDERLTFEEHARKAATKSKRCIGALSGSVRKWASVEILKTVISSIALPILLYAIEIWYPPDISHQRIVARVQKFAARLLTNNFNHQASYDELLAALNWRPIHIMVAEKRLITLHNYLSGKRFIDPKMFPLDVDVDRRSQRLKSKKHHLALKIFQGHRNQKEDKMAASQMRILWNALPEEAVVGNLEVFKIIIKSDEVMKVLHEKGAISLLENV
jgi:hypothetical protein